MSLTRSHVMASNARLIRQISKDLFGGVQQNWQRVYSEFCKRHGELMPNRAMQFKYKGGIFFLKDDVPLRSGVQQLHESLVPEFAEAYKMFVDDVSDEIRVCQNMLAHAIRIAKTADDLIEILPECMHAAVHEAGFFQLESKPTMSIDDVKEFNELYQDDFHIFDMRILLGATM